MGKMYVAAKAKPKKPKQLTTTQVSKMVARAIDKATEDKLVVKTLRTDMSSIPITTWTEINLCNPAQGLTNSTRVGRRIKIKSLEFRGIIAGGANESAFDDMYNTVRVVFALWNTTNDTPIGNALDRDYPLQSTTYTGAQKLIKKLYDKQIGFQVASTEKAAGDGYAPEVKSIRFYKRFKNLYIEYADDSTTYPNKRLIMSCVSDSAAVPNPGFIGGYTFVKFEDA